MVPVHGKLLLYNLHRTTSLTRRRTLKLDNTQGWQSQVVGRRLCVLQLEMTPE